MALSVPIDNLLADAASYRGRCGRPLVTLSYAQSLDGSIALARGSRLALSGPEALVMTHQLRAAHDAILVGIGTVLADRPQLNVRLVEGKDPKPVILDSRLRFPLRGSPLCGRQRRTWVATTCQADLRRQRALEEAGVRVIRVAADPMGLVDLPELLSMLGGLGVRSVMVEGGARVITSFLNSRLVELAVITVAPSFIGGLRAVEKLRGSAPAEKNAPANGFLRLEGAEHARLGNDLVVWGRVV